MRVIKDCVLTFSKNNKPVENAAPGELLLFETMDCFANQFRSEEQLVHELDLSKANPATGPVFVEGAEPGDVIVVDILDIDVCETGFACTIGGTGPLSDQFEVRTRMIPVKDGIAHFNDVSWQVDPMIGVIGTAPSGEDVVCGLAGDHGGNLDSRLISKGSRVYLPVRVPGGLLQMGDLHASMGDGEICGTGIEIAGRVLVRVELLKSFELNWPVTETSHGWYVNAVGPNYDYCLYEAAKEMCRLMKPVYGWDATDIQIYLSIQGNVEVNQATRPMYTDMMVFRLGIPKRADKAPLIK